MAKRHKKKTQSPETIQTPRPQAKAIRSMMHGKLFLIQVVAIVAATFWIFWPALHGDWIWDDNFYITQNPLLHDPARLWKAWFEPGSFVEYYPIEESVQWAQWQLWHTDTFGYHLTNVFLHIINALLVWHLLNKFGLRLAWLGGLLFAIHPVQVESVAWIVELKNTLSLPPFLLAMCFYIDYDRHGKLRDYLWATGLFLVAMLCKPSMVMFPVVILLYVWWKRDRVRWEDLKTSAPFFVISLVQGLLTLLVGAWYLQFQHAHSSDVPVGGILSRLALAGLSLSFYFSKCFLPIGLLAMYPKWSIDPPSPILLLPWLVLVGVIYWFWTKREGWGRHALLGLGFFLINLALFIGFITGAFMSFTWVMDHFLYIPIIGLIGLVVAGLEQAGKKLSGFMRSFAIAIVTVVMALMAWESHSYAEKFVDEAAFWNHTLKYNPGAWAAHQNLGGFLFKKGRISEAIEQYEQAIKISPDCVNAYYSLGIALLKLNQISEAKKQFEQALKIYPDYAEVHNSLGSVLGREGRAAEAIDQFEQAIKLDPDYAEAHKNLGIALLKANRIPDVIEQFQQVAKLNPDDAEACNNLGYALEQGGRIPEAIEQYEQAIKLNPDFPQAYNSLGSALGRAGRISEAIEQYEQAIKLKPDYAEAHDNLGYALSQVGRVPEAIEQCEQALKINSYDTNAQSQLRRLQSLSPTSSESGSSEK